MIAAATISPCERYRYTLARSWGEDGGSTVLWVMLNPSTADAAQDDPTIRKCVGFSQRHGYSRLVVVNLFALRSTDPKVLPAATDPIGPDNDAHLIEEVRGARIVVAAWGAHGALLGRDQAVRTLISKTHHVDLFCLGKTKGGHPRHPLYVSYQQPLVCL